MTLHVKAAGQSPLVLAILTIDDMDKDFRGNRNNFIDLIETGKQVGVFVYVTTVNHLKLQNRKIIGFTYDASQQRWERRYHPLPQVIYNRIPQREDEWAPEVKNKIDECLNHPTIGLFNPSFFNKWMLFKWLTQNKRTRRFVPVTRKYRADINLLPLLKKYPYLYLKPEKGKAGVGIMRIRRIAAKKPRYAIDIQEKGGNHVFRFTTQEKLKLKINEYAASEDYIVQQGIRLLRCNDRPFDLRVLVQKNRMGLWSITGIGARQAGELSITTHVPRGGTIENPRKLLTASLNAAAAGRILNKVRRSSIIIAKQIERASGSQLGEISLDLGVDRMARLWFFEANSKPMKFDEPPIRRKSLIRLLQYSAYLVNKRQIRHN